MVKKYYLDNKQIYIEGFAKFMKEQADEEFFDYEIKKLFKEYMYDYKNIKVDLRNKFWVSVMREGMITAGFHFHSPIFL